MQSHQNINREWSVDMCNDTGISQTSSASPTIPYYATMAVVTLIMTLLVLGGCCIG
jgi:hypothetical protein